MIDAVVREYEPGERVLWVIFEVDEHGEATAGVEIPLGAIASRRELWGYDDPAEALEAIIDVYLRGTPPADPETGENVFTEAYELLMLREQAREDEAAKARAEQCTEDVIVERAEKAAYDAVHMPVNGGECAMDRCRREARRKLGLPDPAKRCGAETRSKRPEMPARLSAQARAMRPTGGKAQALDALADQGDYLQECTKHFLHSLTDREADPLEPPAARKPVKQLLTPAQVLAKYQEAH